MIIHLDVNRTIIAFDKAQHKGLDSCIDSALAKRYLACWDPQIKTPINYYNYVYQYLSPGDRSNALISKKRKQLLAGFLPYLEKNHTHIYKQASLEKNQVLTRSSSEEFFIFPSFYELLRFLNKKNIGYTIVFRTFGDDLSDIKEEIKKTLYIDLPIFLFEDQQLLIKDQLISDPIEIYNTIKSYSFLAIKDDFHRWASNKELRSFSKPMFINPLDKETLCFFFDDNIERETESGTNIVNPLNTLTNDPFHIDLFLDHGFMVQVDMIDAILKDDYFSLYIDSGLKKEEKWHQILNPIKNEQNRLMRFPR